MAARKKRPAQSPLKRGTRMEVFSIKRDGPGRSVWVKMGSAWVNRSDGSLNVYLDVLPLEGHLHVREALSAGPPKPKSRG